MLPASFCAFQFRSSSLPLWLLRNRFLTARSTPSQPENCRRYQPARPDETRDRDTSTSDRRQWPGARQNRNDARCGQVCTRGRPFFCRRSCQQQQPASSYLVAMPRGSPFHWRRLPSSSPPGATISRLGQHRLPRDFIPPGSGDIMTKATSVGFKLDQLLSRSLRAAAASSRHTVRLN